MELIEILEISYVSILLGCLFGFCCWFIDTVEELNKKEKEKGNLPLVIL